MSFDPQVIRDSFAVAQPIAAQVIDKFYEILWTKYPGSKALFEGVSMDIQKKALSGSLQHIVNNLENPQLATYLRSMGARHVSYGTQDEHYAMVGDALLSTFAFFFKEAWTPELQQNWTDAIQTIASLMIEGAHGADAFKKAS